MYQELFQQTNAQFSELLNPARKFNTLVLNNLEKLVQFQIETSKAYSDLAIDQLRAALDVSDAQSLQTYVSRQQKVAETVGQKLSEDASTLASLSKDFSSEVQKLAQENVSFLSQFSQPKKPAAKAAPARKSA